MYDKLVAKVNNIDTNTKHVLVENGLKNYKHLIQVILELKGILKKMVLKII